MFDFIAFVELAANLARRGDEAADRSAIGRAYYAAFHACRDHLDAGGERVSRGSSGHGEVLDNLSNLDLEAGQNLRRLHRMRRAADYEAVRPIDAVVEAKTAVSLARLVVSAVDRLA
jgi:uncharacterized protein (UPF0332 family)